MAAVSVLACLRDIQPLTARGWDYSQASARVRSSNLVAVDRTVFAVHPVMSLVVSALANEVLFRQLKAEAHTIAPITVAVEDDHR